MSNIVFRVFIISTWKNNIVGLQGRSEQGHAIEGNETVAKVTETSFVLMYVSVSLTFFLYISTKI